MVGRWIDPKERKGDSYHDDNLNQVHNIVDKACKEMAMEKMLRDLEVSF